MNLSENLTEKKNVYSGLIGIRVNRKKINQNVHGIVSGYIQGHLAQIGKKKNRIVKRERSCEGHLKGQHRTRFRSYSEEEENSLHIPNLKQKTISNLLTLDLKGNYLRSTSMEGASTSYPAEKGVTGILNMRNTCYMNAALQAVRHNTELSAFFLENKHDQWINRKPNSAKVELVKGYADLLRALWSGSRPAYVRPEGFLQAMHPAAKEAGFDHFTVPLQHDSHEFLTFFLDQLHEGMAEEVSIEITRPPVVSAKDKAIQSALETWKNHFGKSYSPLTEMIYGLIRVSLTCTKCNNTHDNWETFNCLKLSIPQRSFFDISGALPTIETMLKEEFHEETIEGYACDHCKPERTTVKRTTSIWRLPRMLCLVLKRFTPDGRKIHTRIQFNNQEAMNFGSFFSPDSPEPSKNIYYDLFATVDHHGVAGGGHYTAQAKSPLTDAWSLFDDELAQPIPQPVFGESTYILILKPSSKASPA